MSTLTALQTAQQHLAARYAAQRPHLFPEEDRAYLSMLGKLETLRSFLSIPPDQAAGLPASGEGSMIEAEKMAAAMAADVEDFVVNEEIAENICRPDDGAAAKAHLAAGRAIYYGDDRYPEGVVKEYPDGRRQLIAVSSRGEQTVIRDI